jgi:hypothetical protein
MLLRENACVLVRVCSIHVRKKEREKGRYYRYKFSSESSLCEGKISFLLRKLPLLVSPSHEYLKHVLSVWVGVLLILDLEERKTNKESMRAVGNVASISEAALVFSVFNYFKVW